MEQRRIYVSHAAEDAGRVERLLAVLTAVGIETLTASPDSIGSASTFVACLSAGADGVTRYHRDELQRAIAHARRLPAEVPWMLFAQWTPCTIPSFSDLPCAARVLDLGKRWTESIVELIAPSSEPAAATISIKTKESLIGGDAVWTNVDQEGPGAPGASNARAEFQTEKLVVDGSLNFTNVRRR